MVECKSRIIIVFTKADLVDDPIKKAKETSERITESLSRKSNCLSIRGRNGPEFSARGLQARPEPYRPSGSGRACDLYFLL